MADPEIIPPHMLSETTYAKPEHGWTCFHCGETFVLKGLAAEHFGTHQGAEPACQIKKGHERHLVGRVRDQEAELARYRAEDSDTDRAMHGMVADHARELIRAEEKGYKSGLRDGMALIDRAQFRDLEELAPDAQPPVTDA